MKILVECCATVEVTIRITAAQKRKLEAGQITLDHIIDESVVYDALRTDGDIEFVDWDEVPKKERKS